VCPVLGHTPFFKMRAVHRGRCKIALALVIRVSELIRFISCAERGVGLLVVQGCDSSWDPRNSWDFKTFLEFPGVIFPGV